MHPYEYDDERVEPSSPGEYGRQVWDEMLDEDDERSDADDQVHLSRKAEQDLLEFANDRLRNRETSPVVKVWIFLILSFAMLMLAIGYVADREPVSDPPRPVEVVPNDIDFQYFYSHTLRDPICIFANHMYELPCPMSDIIDSNVVLSMDPQTTIGSDPVTVTLYDPSDINTVIGTVKVYSQMGNEIPLYQGIVTELSVDPAHVWFQLPWINFSYSTASDIESALQETGLYWGKFGSGSKSTYMLAVPQENGSRYELWINTENDTVSNIRMTIAGP